MQIDANRTGSASSTIFSILKIDLLNIDSPAIALRKIAGDWKLFAEVPHRVTRGFRPFASDKKMGVGS
jgi:hypothetical protein